MLNSGGDGDSQKIFDKLVGGGKAIVSGRCYVNTPLAGDIDLSQLRGKGISELWFQKGDINQLYNFPDSLKRLVVRENKLSSIPVNELTNLAILDAEANQISDVDLSMMPNLTFANLSKNKLRSVANLPPKMVEIVVDYNPNLNTIDLEGAESCNKVSCRGKPQITIIGANKRCNIRTDDGAYIRRGGAKKRNPTSESTNILYPDPIEAFDKYYKLKSDYEASRKQGISKIMLMRKPIKERLKLARQFVPKCINCKRKGGTVFERRRDAVLIALCGVSTIPCDLNIEIRLGDNADQADTIKYFEETAQKIKDDIMKLKLDTLFNYVSEDYSVEMFTKLSNSLNDPSITKYLSEYKQFYDSQYYNPETNKIIKDTMSGIYNKLADIRRILDEYRKNGANRSMLADIGQLQLEIDTDTKMIRRLKYPVIEMIQDSHSNSRKLIQKTYEIHNFIEPEVVRFQYGSIVQQPLASNPDDDVIDYVPNSPEYNPPVSETNDYDYVPNSPELAPYIIYDYGIEWNNQDYKNAWNKLPKYHQNELLNDPDWLKETLESMVKNQAIDVNEIIQQIGNNRRKPMRQKMAAPVNDLILPSNLAIPPLISETGELDFGNESINKLVSQLSGEQKHVLVDKIQFVPIPDDGSVPRKYGVQPRTGNMTAEEKSEFTSMLEQMLKPRLRYYGSNP